MEHWNIYDGGVISDHFLMLCFKKKYYWKFFEYEQKRSGILEEEATEKGINIPLDKICKIISDWYPNFVFENLGSQLDFDFSLISHDAFESAGHKSATSEFQIFQCTNINILKWHFQGRGNHLINKMYEVWKYLSLRSEFYFNLSPNHSSLRGKGHIVPTSFEYTVPTQAPVGCHDFRKYNPKIFWDLQKPLTDCFQGF